MQLLQAIVFFVLIRPLIMIFLGLNIQGEERLPLEGPAIIAPNHNSHLDTLTLLSLWPLNKLYHVRPVAAEDYFLKNPVLAWLTLNLIRIIPIDRKRTGRNVDPLDILTEALTEKNILLMFPEGSRGTPEEMSEFKSGIARLVERNQEVPIVPAFTHGLGKSLPRGDPLFVPFFADIIVGEPVYWQGSVDETMNAYQEAMDRLVEQLKIPAWE